MFINTKTWTFFYPSIALCDLIKENGYCGIYYSTLSTRVGYVDNCIIYRIEPYTTQFIYV